MNFFQRLFGHLKTVTKHRWWVCYYHYEFWQDNFDFGCKPVQMPYKYALELMCDFLGAGRAYSGKFFSPESEYKWWLKKKGHGIKMHSQTLEFVNMMMEDFLNSGFINTLVRARGYYDYAAVKTQSKDSHWRDIIVSEEYK